MEMSDVQMLKFKAEKEIKAIIDKLDEDTDHMFDMQIEHSREILAFGIVGAKTQRPKTAEHSVYISLSL